MEYLIIIIALLLGVIYLLVRNLKAKKETIKDLHQAWTESILSPDEVVEVTIRGVAEPVKMYVIQRRSGDFVVALQAKSKVPMRQLLVNPEHCLVGRSLYGPGGLCFPMYIKTEAVEDMK